MKRKWILITPVVILLLILPAIAVGMEERRTVVLLNEGGLADHIKITIKKSDFLSTLFRGSVFFIEFWSNYDDTLNFIADVEVVSKKGDVIFERKHDLMPPLEPRFLWSWGYWYYIQFRQQGFLFGSFDINVKIQVIEDASIKTQTAHGFIFGISAIIWD